MARWFIKRTNPDFIAYLARESGISSLIAQVLVNRGINEPDTVAAFLAPGPRSIADPLSLPGMEAAAGRIRRAARSGERVLVHGDYDADGVTATAIVVLTLRQLGIPASYFIPNRFDHGYGFNREAIDIAVREGIGLIVTVDCGMNSFDEAAEAKARGIDVIITDHHEPTVNDDGSFLSPDAVAVVNPKLAASPVPLCGAGVALKLSQALLGLDGAAEFFDLAAVGTVADMVPLVDENRVIVKNGLALINSGARASIAALREAASAGERSLSAGMLSFTLIPRINASGRMAEASDVVRLFLTGEREETARIARSLNANNAQRSRVEEAVFQEALAMVNARSVSPCIVLSGEDWHEGVIGIVASKIAGMFNRPAFVFSMKNGIARGSARSIPAFDICEGLSLCSDLLIRYGGHKQAAGITMESVHLESFQRRMSDIIAAGLRKDDFQEVLCIDAEVALREVTFRLVRDLSQLEPFGYGNEEPLFAARDLECVGPRIVGRNHLKMKLRHNTLALDAIGFDLGDHLGRLEQSPRIDAVFSPGINEWNGARNLQLTVKGLRPSD